MSKPNSRIACIAILLGLATSGCSTFSFAPPYVDTNYRGKIESHDDCIFTRATAQGGPIQITPDIEGALALADNYEAVYRCSLAAASDGRQIFEVPSLLALVAAGLGGNFGLSEDGRLAAAGGALVYNRANSYFAPAEKAGYLDAALDAVTCVKNRAVGVGFFNTRDPVETNEEAEQLATAIEQTEEVIEEKDEALAEIAQKKAQLAPDAFAALSAAASAESALQSERAALARLRDNLVILQAALQIKNATRTDALTISKETNNGTIEVDVRRQYFQIIAGGLSQIDQVLGRRLRAAGTVTDPQSLATELQALAERSEDQAEQQAEAEGAATNGAAKMARNAGVLSFDSEESKNERLVEIQIDQLETNVQQCVARAKL